MDFRAESKFDAIVVGGGHNGLIAAAYLAHAGVKLVVLEKSAVLGVQLLQKRLFQDLSSLVAVTFKVFCALLLSASLMSLSLEVGSLDYCSSVLSSSGGESGGFGEEGCFGGAAVTEEIIPGLGFKFSRWSYVQSLLRPVISRCYKVLKDRIQTAMDLLEVDYEGDCGEDMKIQEKSSSNW